jgi:hypothetical protein
MDRAKFIANDSEAVKKENIVDFLNRKNEYLSIISASMIERFENAINIADGKISKSHEDDKTLAAEWSAFSNSPNATSSNFDSVLFRKKAVREERDKLIDERSVLRINRNMEFFSNNQNIRENLAAIDAAEKDYISEMAKASARFDQALEDREKEITEYRHLVVGFSFGGFGGLVISAAVAIGLTQWVSGINMTSSFASRAIITSFITAFLAVMTISLHYSGSIDFIPELARITFPYPPTTMSVISIAFLTGFLGDIIIRSLRRVSGAKGGIGARADSDHLGS